MEDIDKLLFTEISAEAERSVSLGDVLDMKANIWLVVITFLAAQTAYFLTKDLTPLEHRGQILSAILFVIAGMLTLVELCPRTYMIYSPSNGALEERIAELQKDNGNSEDSGHRVAVQIMNEYTGWAKERIATNQHINRQKSKLLNWSFWLTAAGTAINFLTLLHFVRFPF
jgi:hypothetical protein